MANALSEAARGVDTAWCKGDLREEAAAKDAGDSYCAVSHLAKAMVSNTLALSLDAEYVGEREAIAAYDAWFLSDFDNEPEEMDDYLKEGRLNSTYEWVSNTPEAKALRKAIIANYGNDRMSNYTDDDLADSYIIWNFNDHQDTTREEVVAMMEKAAIALDDAAVAEDKATDDLVEEIDELLGV